VSHILLVEDDPDSVDIYETRFVRAGHTVRVAEDGHAALRLFQQEPPDAVVIDIMLPGKIDGFSVLEHVMDEEAPPPCIVITALAGDENRERAEALGCAAFIEKPLSPRALLAVVEEKLKRNGEG
jgi:DNA-binding response OmpR family regulator